MWDRRAKLVRIHDGDTITVVLDQGFRDTKEIDLRLFGVHAPELKEVGGPETRDFVFDWFLPLSTKVTWPFIVTTVRMPIADREMTTLERYLGTVTDTINRNLNVDVMAFVASKGYGPGM